MTMTIDLSTVKAAKSKIQAEHMRRIAELDAIEQQATQAAQQALETEQARQQALELQQARAQALAAIEQRYEVWQPHADAYVKEQTEWTGEAQLAIEIMEALRLEQPKWIDKYRNLLASIAADFAKHPAAWNSDAELMTAAYNYLMDRAGVNGWQVKIRDGLRREVRLTNAQFPYQSAQQAMQAGIRQARAQMASEQATQAHENDRASFSAWHEWQEAQGNEGDTLSLKAWQSWKHYAATIGYTWTGALDVDHYMAWENAILTGESEGE